MAAARTCAVRERQVKVDVRGGEFLRYEVSFRGAVAKFIITDEDERKILDETGKKTDGVFTAEWPPMAGWVWDGADSHIFVGVMALALTYRVRVSLCRANGTTMKVIRDCTFQQTKNTDVAFERLSVFVAKEVTQ